MCNSWKVIEFISTEVYGSTDTGDTYLSLFRFSYSNVSIFPDVCLHILQTYFNVCNDIDQYNKMQRYDLSLDKY